MAVPLTDQETSEIEMTIYFPFMEKSETDTLGNVYGGFVTIFHEDIELSVTEHGDKTFTFTLPTELTYLTETIKKQTDATKPKNIVEFLKILTNILKDQKKSSVPVNYCEQYRHLIRECSEITKFYLDINFWELSHDLGTVRFSIIDDHNREHFLGVKVNWNVEMKDMFDVVNFNLPLKKEDFKPSNALMDIYEQFKGFVERLQPFFDLMDVLDKQCWVFDPVPPQMSFKYRRICIGENISMILTVDPMNVANIPDVKFLGPEKLTEQFRTTVNENLQHWDSRNDIYYEILHLIGLNEFPQKKASDSTRFTELLVDTGECNICFSQRLNEKLPEIVCKNHYCGNFFHVDCLYEWLMSINSKKVFKEVIGNCPNCEKSISCPIPV